MDKLLNEFTGTVRRAVDDYHMIEAGDTVAVGVSGGKDSMLLLLALNHLRSFYPKPFSLEAITIELGFEGMDFSPVAALCEELGVPYTCLKTDIKEIVFDVRKEENPCSLCAKMRRGALNDAIRARGVNKLALGHHFDDAVETFMLSLLFEGRLSCFRPVTYLDRSGVTQIQGTARRHGGGLSGHEIQDLRRDAAPAPPRLGAGRKLPRPEKRLIIPIFHKAKIRPLRTRRRGRKC